MCHHHKLFPWSCQVTFRRNVCFLQGKCSFFQFLLHVFQWNFYPSSEVTKAKNRDYPNRHTWRISLCKTGTSIVLALRLILCVGRTCYSQHLELAILSSVKGSTGDRLRQTVDLVKRYLTSTIGKEVDPHKEKRAEKWKLLDRAGKHSAENTDQSRELYRVSSKTSHHSILLLLCCHWPHPASALAPTNSERAVDPSVQREEDGVGEVPLEKFSSYFLL